jgi:PEP-CTERM/exosortase A-associated glycosyltransferase
MTTSLVEQQTSDNAQHQGKPYRVLHVLDHSLPLLAGYTIRSRDIVNGQRAIGFDPVVVTSPLHELRNDSGTAEIEGTTYLRTPLCGLSGQFIKSGTPVLRETSVVRLLSERIVNVLDGGNFDLVHSHSPVLCGLAAYQAARKRNLPFVYEIRAFWEDAAVDQNKTTERSLRYRSTRALENYVTGRADAVVGIAHSIVDELKSRGLPKDKLFHVPNGVDINKFKPRPKDAELAASLGLGDEVVFGFVGSLFHFEGVAWLVRAAAELRKRGVKFQLLIMGGGEEADAVRSAIRETESQDVVQYLGKIPPDDIARYYSLLDVLVYPRISIRLTELVTPLKPLEAMAQEKAVLASSVGGLRELVEHEDTGLLFRPESIEDFCQQATRLCDAAYRRQLGAKARTMVLEEKNWVSIAERYRDVYAKAIRNHVATNR